ncbi:MAG TPA: Zn-ribbon domain-containing OB-fold protein [Bacillota bacterium]
MTNAATTPAGTPQRPLPEPTPETRPYWEAAREGRLLVQRCNACGHRQFYPRRICTRCLSEDLGWIEASGRGTIYTFTVTHRAAGPAFEPLVPYVCAIIELEEGVRMLSNIIDCDPAQLRIGQRVQVDFLQLSPEIALPVFRPLADAEGR